MHRGPDQTTADRVALREARTGDLLPSRLLPRGPARRLAATAVVVPGNGGIDAYLDALAAEASTFADWDGRVTVAPPDGARSHRVLVVDRYRQVYAVTDAETDAELPTAHDLSEWFRFLATACPECGVLDDPLARGPTP